MKDKLNKVFLIISLLIISLPTLNAAPSDSAAPKTELFKEQAIKYMVSFQDAIKEEDWEKALAYCSSKVKSKAKTYESVEDFFKDVLPIENITSLSKIWISQTGHYNNITRYGSEISLNALNYSHKLKWILSVVYKDTGMVIEFPVKPLNIWLKHAVLKSKIANGKYRIDPEICRAGFDVHLIPLTEKFAIGRPMLFRVEIKNISKETLGYFHTAFMVNDPILIKNDEGTKVPFAASDSQTIISPDFVEPGETVVLADYYDARLQYHIIKPGKYTFQFKGLWGKPSNIIEKEIEYKPLPAMEKIVEDLKGILPKDWKLSRSMTPASWLTINDSSKQALWLHLLGKDGSKTKNDSVFISVIIFLHNPEQIPHVKLKKHLSNLDFWGESKWGLVYGSSCDAETLWPDHKNEIKKSLRVNPN